MPAGGDRSPMPAWTTLRDSSIVSDPSRGERSRQASTPSELMRDELEDSVPPPPRKRKPRTSGSGDEGNGTKTKKRARMHGEAPGSSASQARPKSRPELAVNIPPGSSVSASSISPVTQKKKKKRKILNEDELAELARRPVPSLSEDPGLSSSRPVKIFTSSQPVVPRPFKLSGKSKAQAANEDSDEAVVIPRKKSSATAIVSEPPATQPSASTSKRANQVIENERYDRESNTGTAPSSDTARSRPRPTSLGDAAKSSSSMRGPPATQPVSSRKESSGLTLPQSQPASSARALGKRRQASSDNSKRASSSSRASSPEFPESISASVAADMRNKQVARKVPSSAARLKNGPQKEKWQKGLDKGMKHLEKTNQAISSRPNVSTPPLRRDRTQQEVIELSDDDAPVKAKRTIKASKPLRPATKRPRKTEPVKISDEIIIISDSDEGPCPPRPSQVTLRVDDDGAIVLSDDEADEPAAQQSAASPPASPHKPTSASSLAPPRSPAPPSSPPPFVREPDDLFANNGPEDVHLGPPLEDAIIPSGPLADIGNDTSELLDADNPGLAERFQSLGLSQFIEDGVPVEQDDGLVEHEMTSESNSDPPTSLPPSTTPEAISEDHIVLPSGASEPDISEILAGSPAGVEAPDRMVDEEVNEEANISQETATFTVTESTAAEPAVDQSLREDSPMEVDRIAPRDPVAAEEPSSREDNNRPGLTTPIIDVPVSSTPNSAPLQAPPFQVQTSSAPTSPTSSVYSTPGRRPRPPEVGITSTVFGGPDGFFVQAFKARERALSASKSMSTRETSQASTTGDKPPTATSTSSYTHGLSLPRSGQAGIARSIPSLPMPAAVSQITPEAPTQLAPPVPDGAEIPSDDIPDIPFPSPPRKTKPTSLSPGPKPSRPNMASLRKSSLSQVINRAFNSNARKQPAHKKEAKMIDLTLDSSEPSTSARSSPIPPSGGNDAQDDVAREHEDVVMGDVAARATESAITVKEISQVTVISPSVVTNVQQPDEAERPKRLSLDVFRRPRVQDSSLAVASSAQAVTTSSQVESSVTVTDTRVTMVEVTRSEDMTSVRVAESSEASAVQSDDEERECIDLLMYPEDRSLETSEGDGNFVTAMEVPDAPTLEDSLVGTERPRRSSRLSRSSRSSSSIEPAELDPLILAPEPRIVQADVDAEEQHFREVASHHGFSVISWRVDAKQICRRFREFADPAKRAEDIPHELQDRINALPEAARRANGMQVTLFEAAIVDNTVDDEPAAPPIRVVNEVDDELTPPFEFYYSNQMWHHPDVPLPDEENLEGCDCIGTCNPMSKTCSCLQRQRRAVDFVDGFLYDTKGRLRVHEYPIFECNALCGCSEDCVNRVVQHGRKYAINIQKTPKKGWGVFNGGHKKIPANTFVGIYAGEYITDAEAERRGVKYNKFGRTYLFDIDFWHLRAGLEDPESWDVKYLVDAYHVGNFTRYLNHSCDPNCILNPCYINDANIDKPLLAIFTLRDVEPREELCFSYYGFDDDNDPEGQNKLFNNDDAVYVECQCGAAKCRGGMWKA